MTEKMKQMEEEIRKMISKEGIEKQENGLSMLTYKNNISDKIVNLCPDEKQRIALIKDNMTNITVKYYCAYSLSDKAKYSILNYFSENEKVKLAETMSDKYKLKIIDELDNENLKYNLITELKDQNKLKVLDKIPKEKKLDLIKSLDDKYKVKAIELVDEDEKFGVAIQLTENYIVKVLDKFSEKEKVYLMSQIVNSKLRKKLDVDNIILNSLEKFTKNERRSLIYTLDVESMEKAMHLFSGKEKYTIAGILPDEAKARVADEFPKKEKLKLLGNIEDENLRKKYNIDEIITENFEVFDELDKRILAERLSDEYVEKIIDFFEGKKKYNLAINLSSRSKINVLDNFDNDDKLKIAKKLNDNEKEIALNKLDEQDKIILISTMKDEKIRKSSIKKSNLENNLILKTLYGNIDLDNIKLKNDLIGLHENITFGVELEVCGPIKIVEPLKYKTSYNNPKKIILGYYLEPDSTINRDSNIEGIEFISPILRDNEKDIKGLEYICNNIKDMGLKTDFTCGGHIHFGVDYFEKDPKAFENLFNIWDETEELFYKMANPEGEKPRSKVQDFAKPSENKIKNLYENGEIELKTEDDLKKIIYDMKKQSVKERNRGLNITNIGDKEKNTIEFRIPNCTIDSKELLNNIRLFGKLFEVSKKMADNKEYKKDVFENLKNKDVTEKRKLETLLNLLFDKEQEKDIYRRRWDSAKEYNIFNELFKENNKFKRGIYTMEEENER